MNPEPVPRSRIPIPRQSPFPHPPPDLPQHVLRRRDSAQLRFLEQRHRAQVGVRVDQRPFGPGAPQPFRMEDRTRHGAGHGVADAVDVDAADAGANVWIGAFEVGEEAS